MTNEIPFPDRLTAPDRQALLAALGPNAGRWVALETFAREVYRLEGEWVYYKSDGWCVRYRRSGKSLFTLTPRRGSFDALVVIGPSAWDAVEEMELSDAVRDAWGAARPYPDGRWLFLAVADDAVVGDIERLVALKSPPPRRHPTR